MKRLTVLVLLVSAAFAPSALAATAQGGGRGTVDGATPFSDFGFGVTAGENGVQGHFNCLMAGSSQFPGFTLMAVRGQVTNAVVAGGAASFDGVGMFQTGNQGTSGRIVLGPSLIASSTVSVSSAASARRPSRPSTIRSWLTTMHCSQPLARTRSRTSRKSSSSVQVGTRGSAAAPAERSAATRPSRGNPAALQSALPAT